MPEKLRNRLVELAQLTTRLQSFDEYGLPVEIVQTVDQKLASATLLIQEAQQTLADAKARDAKLDADILAKDVEISDLRDQLDKREQ